MAKEVWRQFEKRILVETRVLGGVITRIPSSLDRAAGGRTFRNKTDCDFAAAINERPVFFDAKACAEKTFNLKSLVFRDTKIHQYEFLRDAREKGCLTGYLVWFYEQRKIAWYDIREITAAQKSGKASLGPDYRAQPDDEPINLKKLLGGL